MRFGANQGTCSSLSGPGPKAAGRASEERSEEKSAAGERGGGVGGRGGCKQGIRGQRSRMNSNDRIPSA
jgi:hypothetical protein